MSVRILYVEDDADLRRLLEIVLKREGYEVTAVSTAEDAIVELQTRQHQLLLTDYNLPHKNADWMLRVARDGGYLQNVAVVVLTAATAVDGIDVYRQLRKPVDISVLFTTLDEVVSAHERELEMGCAPAASDHHAVELMLYVTGASRESKKAVRNLRRVMQTFGPGDVRFRVCDVSTLGEAAWATLEADRVVVTPTLVRQFPTPKIWMIGDLENGEAVREMIESGLADAGHG